MFLTKSLISSLLFTLLTRQDIVAGTFIFFSMICVLSCSFQDKMYQFCSKTCCEDYKKLHCIVTFCEYCQEEKTLHETVKFSGVKRPFCSEGTFILSFNIAWMRACLPTRQLIYIYIHTEKPLCTVCMSVVTIFSLSSITEGFLRHTASQNLF